MIEANKFDRLYARGVSTSITRLEFLELRNNGHAVLRTVSELPDGKLEGEITWHYRTCRKCAEVRGDRQTHP